MFYNKCRVGKHFLTSPTKHTKMYVHIHEPLTNNVVLQHSFHPLPVKGLHSSKTARVARQSLHVKLIVMETTPTGKKFSSSVNTAFTM